jgi:hypothetical protein
VAGFFGWLSRLRFASKAPTGVLPTNGALAVLEVGVGEESKFKAKKRLTIVSRLSPFHFLSLPFGFIGFFVNTAFSHDRVESVLVTLMLLLSHWVSPVAL